MKPFVKLLENALVDVYDLELLLLQLLLLLCKNETEDLLKFAFRFVHSLPQMNQYIFAYNFHTLFL